MSSAENSVEETPLLTEAWQEKHQEPGTMRKEGGLSSENGPPPQKSNHDTTNQWGPQKWKQPIKGDLTQGLKPTVLPCTAVAILSSFSGVLMNLCFLLPSVSVNSSTNPQLPQIHDKSQGTKKVKESKQANKTLLGLIVKLGCRLSNQHLKNHLYVYMSIYYQRPHGHKI